VLRDREASLRRRLMEHWSGVMAWEVRRLERASADTQARFDRQSRQLAINKDRDNELLEQVKALEEEVHRRAGRVAELEENVVEMGRRERAIEEEVRELEGVKVEYERNREGWSREKGGWDREKGAWEEHKRSFEDERQGWLMEKRMLSEAREAALRQSEAYAASPRMSDKDRMVMEQLRTSLGGMLSRKGGVVGEGEVVQCLEEVGRLLERRENEVASLKEEMREVNMGLEEEVRRVRGDRDVWKGKAEKADALKKDDVVALERRMRVGSYSPPPGSCLQPAGSKRADLRLDSTERNPFLIP
jgi:chromosome segregation ATPase